MQLGDLGWSPQLQSEFEQYAAQGFVAGRVAIEHRGAYVLYTEAGELWAELSGRLVHEALGRADLPAVGDWVAARARPEEGRATIHAILPRRTRFSRKVAWVETEEQVLAANVDSVFLVSGLDRDFNLRRLERYLTMAWESGAEPVIVLSKSDLCPDAEERAQEAEAIAFGVPVLLTSSVTGRGLDELRRFFAGNRTGALLGSSGVGKSTLINRLYGAALLETREIRRDGRGRHTTSRRQLVLLPGGGLLLDTPGMRELQLWDGGSGIEETFEDIATLAERCRFRDCRHETEPQCAVLGALDEGGLDPARLQSYRKLQRELRALDLKQDQRARAEERRKRRVRARSMRKDSY